VLARAVAILPMGLSFADAELVYRWTNAAMLDIFGLARDQVVGHRVPEVFPEGWAQIRPILDEVMASGEPFIGRELEFTINGRKAYFDVTYQPVRAADGHLEGILSLAHEVTVLVLERQRQRAQIANLRELDEAKDQFLGILSHELRTPINAILGFSSLLDDEVGGQLNQEQHRFANHILAATDRLLALVNDLLDMSRIQAGKFTISANPMPMEGVVEDVLANLAPAAAAKQIALVPRLQPDRPWVRGDRLRLEQVVANLVGNAIKFTQPGGRVEVRSFHRDGQLRVEVADNGPGIPAWAHEKLFKTFSQVDMSTTRASGGVGLGLAICKSLVEALGGRIGLESQEGQGTTIWFTLPIVDQPPS
jgi:PAS domain S-box-containing protein